MSSTSVPKAAQSPIAIAFLSVMGVTAVLLIAVPIVTFLCRRRKWSINPEDIEDDIQEDIESPNTDPDPPSDGDQVPVLLDWKKSTLKKQKKPKRVGPKPKMPWFTSKASLSDESTDDSSGSHKYQLSTEKKDLEVTKERKFVFKLPKRLKMIQEGKKFIDAYQREWKRQIDQWRQQRELEMEKEKLERQQSLQQQPQQQGSDKSEGQQDQQPINTSTKSSPKSTQTAME